MNKKNNRKPIHWVGSALDDIREFPDNIKRESITGASKMIDTQIRHTTDANGNVFADLGFAPQEAQQLKSASEQLIQNKLILMNAMSEWIKENHLKQAEAASILGVSRPRISDIVNHKTDKFTLDALVSFVSKTGRSVQVSLA